MVCFIYRYQQEKLNKMEDISDFKRCLIIGASMVGASVTKTAKIFWCSNDICLESNDSIWEGRKNLRTEAELWKKAQAVWYEPSDYYAIAWKDHKNTTPKITEDLNDHLENTVFSKTVRRELQKAGFHWRAAIRKPLLSQTNIAKRLELSWNL